MRWTEASFTNGQPPPSPRSGHSATVVNGGEDVVVFGGLHTSNFIGETVVRGRIDAVFADPDGGVTVVDWKTGEPPSTPEELQRNAVQLAVYRLAWAGLHGCDVASVRAAFHYVRTGRTVTPDVLPDSDELAALLDRASGDTAA